MSLWPKTTKWKLIFLALVLLVVGLVAVHWNDGLGVLHGKRFSTAASALLVLEDCDSDFRTPPFEDAVVTFGANRKPVRKVTGLNICETVGGCRSLSVAPDGRFFTVCENVSQKLTAYRLNTGERLWSLKGDFTSASISRGGMVYALSSDGSSIYGKQLLQVDPAGQIVRQTSVGGFDLALDEERKVLWLAGKTIKRCDLQFKVLQELNSIGWCAFSIALSRDGAVWVAERQHPDVAQSTNRIVKLSPEGQVLKAVGLPFSPLCLRVDRSDGSVWVTGVAAQESATRRLLDAAEKHTGRLPLGQGLRDFLTRPRAWSRTHKYDQNGTLLCELRRGGFSLDINQADGSVWIGGKEKVYYYSRQGTFLGQSSGVSSDQKYVAVVPESGH